MKLFKLILLYIVSLSLTNLWAVSITSATYNAGTNVMTITFLDSVNTDSVRLGRLSLDDDYGGPNADAVFTGGTILTENTLSSEIQASLIYGGIIDHWTNPDDQKTRDIWGNNLTLINALEALDFSSLQLVIEEGAFINNIAEPFVDTDTNGTYSSAEQFTDLNSNGTWDDAEEFGDTNGNGDWDSAEVYTDAIGNDVWDSPEEFTDADSNGVWNDAEILFNDANGNGIWDSEEFTDCGLDNDGILICDGDDGWDESFGNGVWDDQEEYYDLNNNSIWDAAEDFIDENGNGEWDTAESYTSENGDGEWTPAEDYTDSNSNGEWDPAEDIEDLNGNGVWDSEDFIDEDGNGQWFPGEDFIDLFNFNGVWDPGEYFIDANSNGVWDPAENYTDSNFNGVWDPGEEYIDGNYNNQWDTDEDFFDEGLNDVWDPGEEFTDSNDNEVYDSPEDFTDINNNGTWDTTEVYIDANGDGFWNPAESLEDIMDGLWNPPEQYHDQNNNGIWDFDDGNGNGICDYEISSDYGFVSDECELFDDIYGNGIWDDAEPLVDTNGDGVWSPAEQLFTDTNDNGTWDTEEEYIDTNNDGSWTPAEDFVDENESGNWDPGEEYTDDNGNDSWDDAEPFTDTNGDGVWTPDEPLTDANGDGGYDDEEAFTDVNDNGTWDDAEPFEDDNENGVWDSTEVVGDPNGNGIWDDGESFDDNNNNGIWDGIETFIDLGIGFPPEGAGNGVWDFEDDNGNGICDIQFGPNAECEPFEDDNGNGICDQETFNDADGDGIWDPPEGFIDTNGNGIWNPAEDFVDADGDGIWFPGEEFTDMNGNNVWDDAEEFTDLNGNGIWDDAEPLVDFDGDNEFDEVSEEFTDLNNNGVWDPYNAISDTTVNMPVTGTNVYPILNYTMYDANINQLMLVFDRPVQFDQIPEDETYQDGPGDGILNSGEDRNENGVLDMEASINSSKISFTDNIGNTKSLEGFERVVQTADNDTMQILLTRDDGRRLETSLNIDSMSVNLSEGTFLDTLYNPSADTMLPATTIMDSLPLLADSAMYNISENKLLIFFRSRETDNRRVVTDPAPIYSKIVLSIGDSSMNLSGINGTPIVLQDIILKIQQLILADQRDMEMLIDEMDTEDMLTLAIDEYAVYDENNNGNLEVLNLPVTITSSDDEEKQPPQIVSSEIVYDAYTDILTLPWNMGVGFFNEIPIPEESGLSDYSDLEGIAFYDSSEDSLIIFGQGEVYYPTSNDTTCVKLSEEDAELLENYPNRAGLTLTVEPYTFYSAIPYNNGNKAVTEDSLFAVNYRWDNTAPMVNEVLFNVIDSTLAITLDELVIVDLLYPEKLTFGGVAINGEIVIDSATQYVSNFAVKVSSSTYDDITSLDDNVKINPLFQSVAGAFVNADSTISGWIDMDAAYGRYFWIQSFEAFPPPTISGFCFTPVYGD